MGVIDLLAIINDWHKEEEKEYSTIIGYIDTTAKVRLARQLELVFAAAPKSDSSIDEKPRRGRPPKNRG